MKKEYINPTMEIVKMETVQMIAASGDFDETLNGNGIDGSNALSREFDLWD